MDEPYVFLDCRGGRLTATVFGSFANAHSDDAIKYVESPSFRFRRERLEKHAEQHRPFGSALL